MNKSECSRVPQGHWESPALQVGGRPTITRAPTAQDRRWVEDPPWKAIRLSSLRLICARRRPLGHTCRSVLRARASGDEVSARNTQNDGSGATARAQGWSKLPFRCYVLPSPFVPASDDERHVAPPTQQPAKIVGMQNGTATWQCRTN